MHYFDMFVVLEIVVVLHEQYDHFVRNSKMFEQICFEYELIKETEQLLVGAFNMSYSIATSLDVAVRELRAESYNFFKYIIDNLYVFCLTGHTN